MTLIVTLIAFGLMIFVHELGHFLAARAFGVGIETFSLGFGKPIVNVVKGGINYRISWLPLGGYLKMKGENPDDADTDHQDAYQSKAWWKRALIAFAGPFANLLLALLIFIISFLLPHKLEDQKPIIHSAGGAWTETFAPGDSLAVINGQAVRGFAEGLSSLSSIKDNHIVYYRGKDKLETTILGNQKDSLLSSLQAEAEAIVGEVNPGYPAWRAGLMPMDKVLAVDSINVSNWYDMREAITKSPNNTILLSIVRADSIISKRIVLESNLLANDQSKMIGITQYMPVRYKYRYPAGDALKNGVNTTISMIVMNYYGLYKLIQRPQTLKSNIGGPVMIATMSQSVGQKGAVALLLFFGGISLLLMIMNLLPIPVLDGGHIMFCLVEGIFRRPVSLRVQAIAQRIGFSILIMLMAYAFYADIQKVLMRLFFSK